MPRVGLSLGSNLGDRLAHLRAALDRLKDIGSGSHRLVSSIYETEPVDCPDGSGAFYNAVVEILTGSAAREILEFCQGIEREMGRPDIRDRNSPRTIDLDLLYHEDGPVDDPDLVLPHPRMFERPFVLIPLAEIRPDLIPIAAAPLLSDPGVRKVMRLDP